MAVARAGVERSEEEGRGELGWGSPHPHRAQGALGMEVGALLVHGRHAWGMRRPFEAFHRAGGG